MLTATPSFMIFHDRRFIDEAAGLLSRWKERISGRRWLAEMTDRELRDIGLSRNDVWEESNKPFWQG
ncbi:hypothetical protein CU669_09675 [Paramagnetospirillum kuznetsovii]|uniref:YjiS-like domain-containing protein n=1 Tax=Paramagnetospirillum kuznetsovii TaxID=2053833 RepID=A0A364NYI0_9PROT|nr:DUF1127 domain-containing protein [Paramagnetospirillum kuznetsovii]RAU21965.1 hypothetical protein CU669_09675 [Paramagnetospirillum kuznetsovii]